MKDQKPEAAQSDYRGRRRANMLQDDDDDDEDGGVFYSHFVL